MIIDFFKRNFEVSLIAVLLIGVASCVYFSFHPSFIVSPTGFSPCYNWFYRIFAEEHIARNIVLSAIAIFNAVYLNIIFIQTNLLTNRTWIPALINLLFYILLFRYPDSSYLIPCVFFLILALKQILHFPKKEDKYESMFFCGALIAAASLFYLPVIFFLVLAYFALINFSLYKLRQWLALLFGALIPYLYTLVYYYWNDQLTIFRQISLEFSDVLALHPIFLVNKNVIFAAICIFIVIILLIFLVQKRKEKSIIFRQQTNMFLLILLFCPIFLFFNPFSGLFFAGIPFTFLLSFYLLEVRKRRLAEVSLWLYIAVIFFFLFGKYTFGY